MSKRQAVVLAGGRGSRLAPVVSDVPKPMAPVAGRPFLRYVLDNLAENGFDYVVVADGYKRETIESYFGDSYRGMRLVYSSEIAPLLTGGAVKKALTFCDNDWVYVLNGDTYFDVNFDAIENAAFGAPEGIDGVVALRKVDSAARYGSVDLASSGVIRAFGEKESCDGGLINGGTYFLRSSVFASMPDEFSMEVDYLRPAAADQKLLGVVCGGMFIDIGIPRDFERAQTILAPLVKRWKIAFFDRDGTINVDTGHLFEPEKLELLDAGVEQLKKYSCCPDCKIVVVTNQAGIAKGLYGEDDMRALHDALDDLLRIRNCHIDAYYFCPHHPDYTGECDCRKPKAGMIKRALRDFDASASECVMFGDRETDRRAAAAAGVRFEWIRS